MGHGLRIEPPYLLFAGDARDALAAKTGQGIVDWRPERCLGQLRLPGCRADHGLPDMTVAEAAAQGARTFVLGTVGPGGVLPETWVPVLVEAVERGMDVASGLHTPLASFDALRTAAECHGRRLLDVRVPHRNFPTGSGRKRSGKRLLTVGTDCAVGKKYTALALERALRGRGIDADFRATGQTGILIAGEGVAVDAVPADFISGAVEVLAPAAPDDHWDVVEGQGSLFHPSFAGVSLGLLHGAQPDAFVVCHEPTRTTMRNVPAPMPSVRDVIEATIRWGRLTNPDIRCVGVAVNTAALGDGQGDGQGEEAARRMLENQGAELGLPATDPMRFGVDAIIERLLGDA